MHINIFWLFIILMMLESTIQYREQYKRKRPFKIGSRYRPKPYYRPRWHPSPRKRYKPPARYSYYNSHKPYYSRSRSPYYIENDYIEEQSQHQPYVIEIELPKKFGKYNNRYSDRHYDRNVIYDDDYLEDDDDYESRYIKPGHRRLKLRGNKGSSPKLRIKISRVDNKDESEELNLRGINSQELNSQELNTQEFNTQELNSQELNLKELNSQELNSHELNSHELNSQEFMNSILPLQATRILPSEHQVSSDFDWFPTKQPQIFPTVNSILPTSPLFDFKHTRTFNDIF